MSDGTREAQASSPELSALLVVGRQRKRGQKSLDSLCRQTAIDRMEIIVVDLAPLDQEPLNYSPGNPVHYHRRPDLEHWVAARREAFRQARAPIAATVEDHAYAHPAWAAALIRAHAEGRWGCVAYGFTNANPTSYLTRAAFVCDYGTWGVPVARGVTDAVPCHNISYRKEALESLGPQSQDLIEFDLSLQQALRRRGWQFFLEPDAVVAHEGFTRIRDLAGTSVDFGRLVASQRAQAERWGAMRRVLFALQAPIGVPLVVLARAARSFWPRPSLWMQFVKALPVLLLTRCLGGIGEAWGAWPSGGNVGSEIMTRWELDVPRETID